MIVVIGGHSRLAQAVVEEYTHENVLLLYRKIYQDWSLNNASDKVACYFQGKKAEDSTIVVASGLLDPRLSPDELLKINFHLPRNIIEGSTKLGFKVVTFGTVMEGLLNSKNPYIRSKVMLGDYVAGIASRECRSIHLRLHTLFGRGEPDPFMFLGQMLDAMRNNLPFEMTLGKQLREYHHVQDDTKAIQRIVNSGFYGVLDISHGHPVSLGEVATYVFQSFGKESLLRVGELPEPCEENFDQIFNRPGILQGVQFRASLPAIVEYMRSLICTGIGKS